jgi:hypothetical protein
MVYLKVNLLSVTFLEHHNLKSFYLLFYKGFFPIWSAILVCVALIFLLIAIGGIIGYWFGCRNPHREFIKRRKEKAKLYKDSLRDEYASLGMMDYSENLYEKPYRN